MARRVNHAPSDWKKDGAPYVPDIGDEQRTWRRFRELQEKRATAKDGLQPAEVAELEALTPEIPELFRVWVMPYSGDEYSEAKARHLQPFEIDFGTPTKGKAPTSGKLKTNMGQAHFNMACAIVAERIPRVENYTATELDPKTGKPTGKVLEPKTGAELVEVIRKHMDDSEHEVVDDLLRAITEVSHLERGLGEA